MAVAVDTFTGARVSTRTYFYFWMALLCAVTAFGGFAPTFWLPMTQGAYVSNALIIHGLLFSTWSLLFVTQTWLVASGRTANHRALGLFGISLATAMTVFGFIAVISRVHRAEAIGGTDAALSFVILPTWHITLFAVLFTAAIANLRRPEWHKRLMLVASISMLDAPLTRLFVYFGVFHGQMPVAAGLPPKPPHLNGIAPAEMLIDLYVLIAIAFDWRKRGRPHPAYLIGLAALLLFESLEAPLGRTQTWHSVASWIVSLAN